MRVPNFSGVGKQIQKVLNLSLAVILSSSSLAVSGPLFLSQKAFAASNLVSSTADTAGWAAQDGSPAYIDGPVGTDGNGSLKLTTDSQSKQNYFKATSTPLSDVSGLGYRVDVTAGVPASYQLQVIGVHRTDSSSTFTSLVWEPVYNGQANGPNGSFVSESNLENGVWWSSHPISGADYVNGQPTYVSLSAIQAANPDATVVAYGINVGSGTPGATSYVDDVSFGSSLTNFEMAPTTNAGDFAICVKNSCGYDGIDVGFSLNDFASISSINVILSKNGQNIVSNTAKQPMIDYYNNHVGTTLSTPFVISAGSFDPSTDTYWSYGSHNWTAAEQPDMATITVVGLDSGGASRTISASNTNLTQDLANFGSFFPGALTVGCNIGDYGTLSAAVSAATAGNTIYVCGSQTISSAVNINTQLNIVGLNGASINTTGSDYVIKINPSAAGTTVTGLTFNKTDSVSNDAMVYVGSNNTRIANNTFSGTFNLTTNNGFTVRGLDVSAVIDLDISDNSFLNVRQPAYINNAGGSISNNFTAGTKGWVVVSQSNINFSGNSWGTGTSANYEDIAIIPDVPVGANNYTDLLAISQTNNNAVVENQVSHQKILGTAPIATPVVNGATASITLPSTNDLVSAVSTSAGTIEVNIPKGTTITAASASWDGTISPPTVQPNASVSIPTPSGQVTTVATVIEVGSGSVSLSFDKAARLVLPAQTGKLVGFIPVGGSFTAINLACGADDQSTVDAKLSALSKNECIYDNGTDMIVWTKHFTTFVAYSQAAQPSTPSSGSTTNTQSSGTSSSSVSTAKANTSAGIGSVTGSDNGSNGEVLGTSSSTPNTPTSTLSTKSTQPSNGLAFTPPAKSTKKILGIAWYFWLLIIAALAVASYLSYSYRSLDRD